MTVNLDIAIHIADETPIALPEEIPSREAIYNAIPVGQYIILVTDGQGRKQIFARKVGEGVEAEAQLLLGPSPNEPTILTVRKVSHDLLTESQTQTAPPDIEVRIFNLLQAHLQIPNINGLTPRFAELTSSGDVELPPHPRGRRWARATFWNYYNGGTVGKMVSRYDNQAKGVPKWLAARFAHQVLQTCQYMYHVVRPAVVHGDMHQSNILLHYSTPRNANSAPDFYVMDFGQARCGGDVVKNSTTDPHSPLELGPWDIFRFLSTFRRMLSGEDKTNRNTPLGGFLKDLEAMNNGYNTALVMPDLMPFIIRAQDLEAMFTAQAASMEILGEGGPSLLPTVYATREEAAGASLHGPYQTAKRTPTSFDLAPYHSGDF